VCARLAAQRLTLLGRARLESAQAACREAAEAGEIPAYLRANEAFHLEIYAATQNPYVQGLAADFRRRTGPFRAKKFAGPEDLLASAESHEALLSSILGGDGGHAYEGMRAHLADSYLKALAAN
jgi:DNA-binding GntR family transcriptional regulator